MPLVDFAILTGLLEEFKVLQDLLPLEEDPDSVNSEVWYRGRLQAQNGSNYELVAAFQSDMGPLTAHDLTTKIIRRWDPAYILLLGIAGSFHEDVRLGDVMVSQQVFYYDPGKATESGIRYRPQGYSCSVTLIRQLEALSLNNATLKAWQD